jgi:hypothetical protein
MNAGNFSGTVATSSGRATGTLTSRLGVANVTLSPAHLMGGASTEITVNLTQPAPGGGIAVQLKSSDASVIATPATVRIPFGQTKATVAALTSPVRDATSVAISALYGDTVAGTSLSIAPATTSAFTVAVQPSTVTIPPGQSGSAKVTTKVTNGYNHALQLTVSNLPAGVSVTLTPPVIPAPGVGTSKADITVPKQCGAWKLFHSGDSQRWQDFPECQIDVEGGLVRSRGDVPGMLVQAERSSLPGGSDLGCQPGQVSV